jgi:hypothetical protein
MRPICHCEERQRRGNLLEYTLNHEVCRVAIAPRNDKLGLPTLRWFKMRTAGHAIFYWQALEIQTGVCRCRRYRIDKTAARESKQMPAT